MCGIIGIWNPNKSKTVKSLIKKMKKLQHRGQDSFGYCYKSQKDNKLEVFRQKGLVQDYFLDEIPESNFAIGHLRYTTSGISSQKQPILYNHSISSFNKEFAVCHNGNLPNLEKNFKHLLSQSNKTNIKELSDTQLLTFYIQEKAEKYNYNWENVFKELLYQIPGVYCLIVLTSEGLWILRDIYGLRPLMIGGSKNDGWLIGSESIIFNTSFDFSETDGLEMLLKIKSRDVKPGTLTHIDNQGNYNEKQIIHPNIKPCIFEYIYFLNPNSIFEEISVADFRSKTGEYLAKKDFNSFYIFNSKNKSEYCVIGAPSTGLISAKTYSEVLNLEYCPEILQKKEKANRTFILNTNNKRIEACKNKYLFNQDLIKDRKIIIVDDSLVRGNTLKTINIILREYGAKEIHIRIASPPVISPCYFGIDIPTREELFYNDPKYQNLNLEDKLQQMAIDLKADSLVYLDLDDLKEIYPGKFCSSCFNNKYDQKLLDW